MFVLYFLYPDDNTQYFNIFITLYAQPLHHILFFPDILSLRNYCHPQNMHYMLPRPFEHICCFFQITLCLSLSQSHQHIGRKMLSLFWCFLPEKDVLSIVMPENRKIRLLHAFYPYLSKAFLAYLKGYCEYPSRYQTDQSTLLTYLRGHLPPYR